MTNTTTKKWYRRSEIIVGIIAIIVPVAASYIINNSKDKKELSISYSQITPIISQSNEIINNLKILYDSTEINNVSTLVLKIKNTGNISLTKSDFIDGPIMFKISNINNTPSLALQVRKKEDENQQNSELNFSNIEEITKVTYLPSLLNVEDEIEIEVYLLNQPTTKISLIGKINNGTILGPTPIEIEENIIGYETFIKSLTSFFYYKWLTITVLIQIFFLSAVSAIFQFDTIGEPEGEGIKPLLFLMGFMSMLIAIFSLIFIVSVIIYI